MLASLVHIAAGPTVPLDRYIGYYEPYCKSHEALDKNPDVREEVRNVARSVFSAVQQPRTGKLAQPDRKFRWPRPK